MYDFETARNAQLNKENKMKTLNKIETKIMLVTPSMAREWLATNTRNRPLNKANVNKFAVAIKTGKWNLIGDAIQFDENGVLVNGQHRLEAVIMADTAAMFLVMWGMNEDAWITEGCGKVKGTSDILCRVELDQPRAVAAAMRGIVSIVMNGSVGHGSWLTNALAYQVAITHGKDISRWASSVRTACETGGVPYRAIYAAMMFMIAAAHGEDVAVAFVDQFFRGLNLKPRTHMFAQRTRVVIKGYQKGTKKSMNLGEAKFYIYGIIQALINSTNLTDARREHEALCLALPRSTRKLIESEAMANASCYQTHHASTTIKE